MEDDSNKKIQQKDNENNYNYETQSIQKEQSTENQISNEVIYNTVLSLLSKSHEYNIVFSKQAANFGQYNPNKLKVENNSKINLDIVSIKKIIKLANIDESEILIYILFYNTTINLETSTENLITYNINYDTLMNIIDCFYINCKDEYFKINKNSLKNVYKKCGLTHDEAFKYMNFYEVDDIVNNNNSKISPKNKITNSSINKSENSKDINKDNDTNIKESSNSNINKEENNINKDKTSNNPDKNIDSNSIKKDDNIENKTSKKDSSSTLIKKKEKNNKKDKKLTSENDTEKNSNKKNKTEHISNSHKNHHKNETKNEKNNINLELNKEDNNTILVNNENEDPNKDNSAKKNSEVIITEFDINQIKNSSDGNNSGNKKRNSNSSQKDKKSKAQEINSVKNDSKTPDKGKTKTKKTSKSTIKDKGKSQNGTKLKTKMKNKKAITPDKKNEETLKQKKSSNIAPVSILKNKHNNKSKNKNIQNNIRNIKENEKHNNKDEDKKDNKENKENKEKEIIKNEKKDLDHDKNDVNNSAIKKDMNEKRIEEINKSEKSDDDKREFLLDTINQKSKDTKNKKVRNKTVDKKRSKAKLKKRNKLNLEIDHLSSVTYYGVPFFSKKKDEKTDLKYPFNGYTSLTTSSLGQENQKSQNSNNNEDYCNYPFILRKTPEFQDKTIYLSGSLPKLGNWDPKNAIKMDEETRNDEEFFSKYIEVKKNEIPFEYKYFYYDNGEINWIGIPFQNYLTFPQFFDSLCSLKKSHISILDLNIRYINDIDGINIWNNRKNKLVELLLNAKADIFFFQEITHPQSDFIDKHLGSIYEFVGEYRDSTETSEKCSICVNKLKYTISHSGQFWLSSTPYVPGSNDFGNFFPRICSWASLKQIDGISLLFMNVHLDHANKKAHLPCVKVLIEEEEKIETKFDDIQFVLIAGCFYCEENDEEIAYIKDQGYNEVIFENTYHGFTGVANNHWDYIFWKEKNGNNIKFKEAHVLKTEGIIDKNQRHYISDHFPVYAEFFLNNV